MANLGDCCLDAFQALENLSGFVEVDHGVRLSLLVATGTLLRQARFSGGKWREVAGNYLGTLLLSHTESFSRTVSGSGAGSMPAFAQASQIFFAYLRKLLMSGQPS